ncbi:hypothetical protein EVAR_96797_1 [Eumeta japonica]|uniref:Uncharacterized protein n=1 Tax=Eumeta variegata TaxID=151549 RepID=A0A4C1WBC9_EUMVA|nr:hypothetical protein EVAR_96797_1 [Eumeta japonica]
MAAGGGGAHMRRSPAPARPLDVLAGRREHRITREGAPARLRFDHVSGTASTQESSSPLTRRAIYAHNGSRMKLFLWTYRIERRYDDNVINVWTLSSK